MAIEFTKDGLISLENREAVFKGGKPVNQPHWDFIKQIPEMVKNGRTYEISEKIINETWNPIIDPLTNITLRSPEEQFLIFCERNMVQATKNHLGVYELKHKWL